MSISRSIQLYQALNQGYCEHMLSKKGTSLEIYKKNIERCTGLLSPKMNYTFSNFLRILRGVAWRRPLSEKQIEVFNRLLESQKELSIPDKVTYRIKMLCLQSISPKYPMNKKLRSFENYLSKTHYLTEKQRAVIDKVFEKRIVLMTKKLLTLKFVTSADGQVHCNMYEDFFARRQAR